MLIKCKMCGGDIQFNPGDTNGQCDHCGCTTTFPKLPDEQRTNLFNRANHFRRQCEFDKAIAAYERILEMDETDAEAHWGIVLSKFGIEYVEDPVSHERIPTCHRAQVVSILSDEDYQNALKYAPDIQSREIYETEAKRISEIQKGILAISSQEKPYDVFICYKETDENGQRTHDSQWAQDVYYGLTEQGYKVFFSRISLEDKLGQEYEPYIFAALQSAKVMVVIGSKPEYFNAVWVKNEWNRYLALMANDRKRLLIPCYRGMDPYDLPDELSSLQSQDMSKIGFMQDLIRGIRKVLDVNKKAEQPKIVQEAVQTAVPDVPSPGVNSLLKRIILFLEDGDFKQASEYIDRVLDIDPEYAPAYAAKVCATFGIRKEAELAETTFQYEDNLDWQKAMRFANPEQKSVYEGYASKVQERISRQIRDYAYDCAIEMAVTPSAERSKLDAELAAYKTACTCSSGNRADGSRRPDGQMKEEAFKQAVKANEPGDVSEAALKTAASMFDEIGDNEASERADQCRELAEQARQKDVYQKAAAMQRNRHMPSMLEEAAQIFLTVPDYKDAGKQAKICLDTAESVRAEMYNKAVSAMNEAGDDSAKWVAVKKMLAQKELENYRNISELRAETDKRLEECIAANEETRRQVQERWRRNAEAAEAKKKRIILIIILIAVLVVAAIIITTRVIIPGNNYSRGVSLRAEGQWDLAVKAFQQAGNYSDAVDQILETRYQEAKSYYIKRDYTSAYRLFLTLSEYKDVDSILTSDENLVAVAVKTKSLRTIGDIVKFGYYEQDNNSQNGPEEIEWIVLDVQDGKSLLLSRYGLEANAYHKERMEITWEDCTLRSWLNKDFLRNAFTKEEQSAILTTMVDNSSSQGYSRWSTKGGNNTEDKIFLLSYYETFDLYFSEYQERMCVPTDYAIKQGAWPNSNFQKDGRSTGWWWLRSPGYTLVSAAVVNHDGFIDDRFVHYDSGCIRPALWIDLDSDIF